MEAGSEKIKLSVGGFWYIISRQLLDQFPETLLGSYEREKYYDKAMGCYHFDRHPTAFIDILYFYQTGGKILAKSENISKRVFLEEMRFFKVRRRKGGLDAANTFDEDSSCVDIRRRVWDLTENPQCWKGILYAAVSTFLILLSCAIVIMESVPGLPNPLKATLALIETVCVCFFVVELVIRYWASPKKLPFCMNWLNLIDAISIAPNVVEFIISEWGAVSTNADMLMVLRILRIVRILRISRRTKAVKIAMKTVFYAKRAIFGCFTILMLLMLIFSSFIFYLERNPEKPEHFGSIPHIFWYTIVTMTTVGYGDMTPVTPFGKLLGAMCAFSGVVVIALPMPAIMLNFDRLWLEDIIQREELSAEDKSKASRRTSRSSRQLCGESTPFSFAANGASQISHQEMHEHVPGKHKQLDE